MKIKNIIISLLIIVCGTLMFTGCQKNVNLKISVNSAEGSVICSANTNNTVTSTETFSVKKKSKVTLNAIANNGYAFQGWNNGNGQVSDKEEYTFIISKNTNLTATFYKESYTINFDYNGLSDNFGFTTSPALTNVKIGDIKTFPTFTLTDKQFLGWYYGTTKISDGGETQVIIPSLTPAEKEAKSFTVKALYKTARTITFNIDGALHPITCMQGDEIQFPTNLITDKENQGFHFVGWFKTDGTQYTATTLTEDIDLTLVARFEKVYIITFAGGTNNEQPIKTWANAIVTLPTYNFTYGDATKFVGWEYNGEVYNATLTYTFTTDITLTAKFGNRYTITYYTNGGNPINGNENFQTYIYQGEKYNDFNLPVPTRTIGCSDTNSVVPPFKCWTYKNQRVTTDTVFDAEHNISLVAQWDIYYIDVYYQADFKLDNSPVFYFGATGDQLMKDVIPYKAALQPSLTSTTEMLSASKQGIRYYTLNNRFGYQYIISSVELEMTVRDFCAKQRTMDVDGVDYAGFAYTEDKMPYLFEFADDYGTPIVDPENYFDGIVASEYIIKDSVTCIELYAAYFDLEA